MFNINDLSVRRFEKEDAEAVSSLVIRNLEEVNIKDYGDKITEKSILAFSPKFIIQRARYAHTYIFEYNNQIVATGSISPYWGSETESIFLTIFVLPEFHKKGIGRKIIETLEKDEYYILIFNFNNLWCVQSIYPHCKQVLDRKI